MAHIAWLGKKSPFCGNVTYGLATTEALRSRGHEISFIHFDTPAGFPLKRDDAEGGLNQGILNQGLKRFRAAPALSLIHISEPTRPY